MFGVIDVKRKMSFLLSCLMMCCYMLESCQSFRT